MVRRHAGAVLHGLDRILNRGTVADFGEGDLLEQFVSSADETAFEALVSRHGPMVLGVCRRALRHEQDIEDAFQATFLVLVRRARSIRDRERVGQWLHGVAHRVAVRARANAARRRVREQTGIKIDPARVDSPPLDDVAAILDHELLRLPESLRTPVVLCYLEGLTHDQAAQRLGWPVGTVRSRMSRARDLLQRRLTRRGVSVPGVAFIPSIASRDVSTALINTTARLAQGTATEKTAAILLAQGVLNAMMYSKLKIFGISIALGLLTLGGLQTFAQREGSPQPVEARAQEREEIKDRLTRDLHKLQSEVEKLEASLVRLIDKKRAVEQQLAEVIGSTQPNRDSIPAMPPPTALAKSTVPSYTRWGDLIVASSPAGDKVSLYYSITRKTKAVRLFEPSAAPHKIIPIFNQQVAALSILGPKVGRIAVFNYPDSSWHTYELREPVESAVPVLGSQIVTYSLGRYVYAFSSVAKRWDVLELPDGAKPQAIVGPLTASVEHGGHIYDFDGNTGKWLDLDVRTLLDAPETTK